MSTMFFKASRKTSNSCDGYRQIIKRGHESIDMAASSDDVIVIFPNKCSLIKIDCDKVTGEFRIMIDE